MGFSYQVAGSFREHPSAIRLESQCKCGEIICDCIRFVSCRCNAAYEQCVSEFLHSVR